MSRPDLLKSAQTYVEHSYPAHLIERMIRLDNRQRYLAPQNLDGAYMPHQPHASPATDLRRMLLAIHPVGVAMHMGKMSHYQGHQIRRTAYELAMDLDLKDYDARARYRIRQGLLCTCAAEGRVCAQCWLLVDMARVTMQYLNTYMAQEAWGPLLTVFSGGKGMPSRACGCVPCVIQCAGCHFYYGSAAARNLPSTVRKGLSRLFSKWQGQTAYLEQIDMDSVFYKPLLEQLHACFVQRGLVQRSVHMQTLVQVVFNQPTEARMFMAHYGHLTPREQWTKLRELNPRDCALFLCALGLPWVDLQAFTRTNGTLKLPFSLHSKRPTIALPLAQRYAEKDLFDPVACAVSIADQGPVSMNPLFKEACVTMNQWLDHNEYPVNE